MSHQNQPAENDGAHRADVHNSDVDELAAGQGLCGMTHLNTGRVCLLPERHQGSCVFVTRG